MIQYKFKNANEAFNFYYGTIPYQGTKFDNTMAMFNQGFTIENPLDRMITNEARNFNVEYAEAELVHRSSTPYYPDWKITFKDRVFYIGQDGTINNST